MAFIHKTRELLFIVVFLVIICILFLNFDFLSELCPNSATCRRPIRGAAGRPVKPNEYWLDETLVQRSIHTESRTYSESLSRPGTVPSSKAPARRGFLSLLLKILLLVAVAGGLYYGYQNLDANQINSLKGLLDNVVVPLQSVVDSAATYLGFGSSAPESAGK